MRFMRSPTASSTSTLLSSAQWPRQRACAKFSLHAVSRSGGGGSPGQGGGPRSSRLVSTAAASTSDYSSPTAGPRICILGGGFGGLYTALRLESLLWPRSTKPRVTLVDQGERFVFKPLLYELLNGGARVEDVAPFFADVLAPYDTSFIQGTVESVEVTASSPDGGGRVVLSDGSAVEYEWLVLALGSEVTSLGIPGVKELALPFCTYKDAMQVRERLEDLEALPGMCEVLVIGTGYSGVEVAATLAERLKGKGAVKLVGAGDTILPGSPSGQQTVASQALERLGVEVMLEAKVEGISAAAAPPLGGLDAQQARRSVAVEQHGAKQTLQADLVIWAGGSGPVQSTSSTSTSNLEPRGQRKGGKMSGGAGSSSALAALKLPFPVTERGAVQTDSTLRVVQQQRVFALGDIAMVPEAGSGEGGQPSRSFPATAQVAFQQADYVAWNLWAAVNQRPLLPFRYQHLGNMMSLGRRNGAVSLPFALPSPLLAALQRGPLPQLLSAAGIQDGGAGEAVTLKGPLAGALRRAAYLYRMPTQRQQAQVGAAWAQQAVSEAFSVAQQLLRSSRGSRAPEV